MPQTPQRKEPPEGFRKTLIELFFGKLDNLEKIANYIKTFEGLGYNLDAFYWMDPQLTPTQEEMRQILNSPEYGLKKEEIERYLKIYLERDRKAA
jgi:hypothetical protein